jgi:hypothetical protein
MNDMRKSIVLLFLCVSFAGCSRLVETSKTIWGSSTRVLEDARVDSISHSFVCDIDDCFDAVLSMEIVQKDTDVDVDAEADKESEQKPEKPFTVFIKDRVKSHIIVYGIPGNVDTTEVGIFFARDGSDAIRIDVASLSSSAKQKVADAIFKELSIRFNERFSAE